MEYWDPPEDEFPCCDNENCEGCEKIPEQEPDEDFPELLYDTEEIYQTGQCPHGSEIHLCISVCDECYQYEFKSLEVK